MSKHSWKSNLGTAALLVAIVVVVNPELRALLLVADALGLEVVLLLIATQFRVLWSMLRVAADPIVRVFCKSSFLVARAAMRTFPVLLPFRPFGALLCPLLLVLSYGLRCPVQDPIS